MMKPIIKHKRCISTPYSAASFYKRVLYLYSAYHRSADILITYKLKSGSTLPKRMQIIDKISMINLDGVLIHAFSGNPCDFTVEVKSR